jgi:two-component system response regulator
MTREPIILLVEDNPKDEALTLRALRKSNILNTVVVARDGVEAIDYLFALPTVILTTSVEDRDRLEGYRLGANSYVRKPVDFAEFVQAVIQLGLYWLVLNEQPPPFRA